MGVTLGQRRVLGRPVKPGDDTGECDDSGACCALARFPISDSHFKQPRVRVLAPPREVSF
jgi:hypothetical protein